jgi:hypothetical protein
MEKVEINGIPMCRCNLEVKLPEMPPVEIELPNRYKYGAIDASDLMKSCVVYDAKTATSAMEEMVEKLREKGRRKLELTEYVESLTAIGLERSNPKKYKAMPYPEKVYAMESGVTCVIWTDGKKTFVKRSAADTNDVYAAIGQAYLKRLYGSTSGAKRELQKITVFEAETKRAKRKERKEMEKQIKKLEEARGGNAHKISLGRETFW